MKQYRILCSSRRSGIVLLSLLILLLVNIAAPRASAQPSVEYPIEVFRVRNSTNDAWHDTASRRIDTKSFAGSADWLYLRVNNLNRANGMQYRVRAYGGGVAGTWTAWQTCAPSYAAFPKDGAYGGLGGGFGTVSFTTPISGLVPNAQHDLEFRFIASGGDESSGYRIIAMELWAVNQLSSPNQIKNAAVFANPADWNGPLAGQANQADLAQQGRDLWDGSAGVGLVDGNGQPLSSSCSGCHAENGYDLKYFNYSDKSIISRANFHGLSRQQGEQIAQYIRDLPTLRSQNGRPWQPPYQPGPAADDDASEWAAGQGLASVAEDDDVLLADMYGSTRPSVAQIDNTINGFAGNTNIRTQRVAVQFPDWNEWLPLEHPQDVFTASEYQAVENAFQTLKSKVDQAGKVAALNAKTGVSGAYANNGVFEAVDLFTREVHKVIGGNNGLTIPMSPVWASNSSTAGVERRKRSMSAWMSVKLFEVIQQYNLHNINDLQNIPDRDEETFQWPSRQWDVFQQAAHIISGNRVSSYFLSDQTETQKTKSIYLSSIWYQLQLTLTPGHRKGGQVEPNDYSYNLQHIHKLGERTGVYEPARFFQNYQKAAEQRSGATPRQSLNQYATGWNMRELSLWRLWSTGRGNTALFDVLPADLRQHLREGYWNGALAVMESYADADWPRTTVNHCPRTDFHLEDRGTVPQNGATNGGNCVFYDRRCSGGCEDANDAVEIDAVYTLLDILKDGSEVDETTFYRIRDWADARWDYRQWPTYQGTSEPSGPPPAPVLDASLTADNTVALSWTGSADQTDQWRVERQDATGSFATIATVAKGTTEYQDTDTAPSTTYAYRVVAVNPAGSAGSDSASITTDSPATPPRAPTGLTANLASNAVLLTWDENSEADVVGYNIYRATASGGSYLMLNINLLNDSYTDRNTAEGTTYYYRVSAVNDAGQESSYSNEVSATIPPAVVAPPTPTNLVAIVTDDNTVLLNWNGDTSQTDEWRIERQDTSGNFIGIATITVSRAEYEDTTVAPATIYTYRVVSLTTTGSSPSDEITVTTNVATETVPAPPVLAAQAVSYGVVLTWTLTDQYPQEYQLERQRPDGSFVVIASLPAQVTTYQDDEVAADTSYVYRLRALDDAGVSPYSNEVRVTLKKTEDLPEQPTKPANTLSPNGDGRNDTWVAIPNQVADCQVRVYDRGGSLIYNNSNYQNDWAGTSRGRLLPPGVYYYWVKYPNGEATTGYLTLIVP